MFSRACFPSLHTRYKSAAWLLVLHNVNTAGWLSDGLVGATVLHAKPRFSFHQLISWNVFLQPSYFVGHLSKLKPLMTTAHCGYGETKKCLYQS
jgi:hypothetical protein